MNEFVLTRLVSAKKWPGKTERNIILASPEAPIMTSPLIVESGISPTTFIPLSINFMDGCLNIVTFLTPSMGFDLIVKTHSPKVIAAALVPHQHIQKFDEFNITPTIPFGACELKTSTAFANENNFVNQPAYVSFKVLPQGGFRTFIVSIPYQNLLSYAINNVKTGINFQAKTSMLLEDGIRLPEVISHATSDPDDLGAFKREFNLPSITRLGDEIFNSVNPASNSFQLKHLINRTNEGISHNALGVSAFANHSAITMPVMGRQVPGTWILSSYAYPESSIKDSPIVYKPLSECLF